MNVLTGILSPLVPQEVVFDSFTDYLIEVLFILALAGTLITIAGLHVLQRERYGRTGAAGSLTAFVGHALLLVAATATALAGHEVLDAVFPLGVLAALVGLVLLGAAMVRGAAYHRFSPYYSLRHRYRRRRRVSDGGRLGLGRVRALAEQRCIGSTTLASELDTTTAPGREPYG
jgi:hypothetical protein